jgi:drug/metabolite transporter superfamily protein YnfA
VESTSPRRSSGYGQLKVNDPTVTDLIGAAIAMVGALVIIGFASRTE